MSGFYQYDTRGASHSTQIINLERMLENRDAEIIRLRTLLKGARPAVEKRADRDDRLDYWTVLLAEIDEVLR